MASQQPSLSSTEQTDTTMHTQATAKELKIRDTLLAKIAALEAEQARINAQIQAITEQLENPAKETIQRHIKLLHDFNEIRDVGLHLLGMIADERGVGLKTVLGEFGVTEKD
ncbi:hypothetical protein Dda_1045 [Drechslerella dactyloides]|uniref:Swi5-domain-containing protein n=1 Tax=Drechslerella dactyloides TaxID=74499 RepID=A0AAD6NNL0_DREDA|nr:hypothetical protein Dda_1045 [Drechslerella dactyloides]